MTALFVRWRTWALINSLALAAIVVVGWRYATDLNDARVRISQRGSRLIDIACGPIECQGAGAGLPLSAVHGSGGGFDQGMAAIADLRIPSTGALDP